MPNSPVCVRFAPSPTGYLHVGGARTALFNWLFARNRGGQFILRIEDTDDARNTEPALRAIFDGLRWLGLDWDEGPEVGGDHGPYFQSQRKHIYDAHLAKLEAAGRTYTEDNGAVRFKFSRQPIVVADMVCGDVHFAATEEPDMTIRRPDGSYIFHFVNVVDDLEMGVTHVIRGEDHLSNTWKHIDLIHAFGKHPPKYAHIPLILNPGGSKMSKRDEGSSIESYVQGGFLPEAVFNYLCLLGWTPRAECEKLHREQLIPLFEAGEIHSANARFDMTKLKWLNAQYMRELDKDELDRQVRGANERVADPELKLPDLAAVPPALSAAAFFSVREKVSTLVEFKPWTHFIFSNDYPFEADALAKLKSKPENKALLAAAAEQLKATTDWSEAGVTAAIEQTAGAAGVKPGAIMPLLRFALSGQTRGPGVNTIAALIGQSATLKRIERTLSEVLGAA